MVRLEDLAHYAPQVHVFRQKEPSHGADRRRYAEDIHLIVELEAAGPGRELEDSGPVDSLGEADSLEGEAAAAAVSTLEDVGEDTAEAEGAEDDEEESDEEAVDQTGMESDVEDEAKLAVDGKAIEHREEGRRKHSDKALVDRSLELPVSVTEVDIRLEVHAVDRRYAKQVVGCTGSSVVEDEVEQEDKMAGSMSLLGREGADLGMPVDLGEKLGWSEEMVVADEPIGSDEERGEDEDDLAQVEVPLTPVDA